MNDTLLIIACVCIFTVLLVGATYNITTHIIQNKKDKQYDIIAAYIVSNMNELVKELIKSISYDGLDSASSSPKEVYEYIKNAIVLQLYWELIKTKTNANLGNLSIEDMRHIVDRIFEIKDYTQAKLYKYYKKESKQNQKRGKKVVAIKEEYEESIPDDVDYNPDFIESEDALDQEEPELCRTISRYSLEGYCSVRCYVDSQGKKYIYVAIMDGCTDIVEKGVIFEN